MWRSHRLDNLQTTEGHMGHFQLLAIMNKTVTSISVQDLCGHRVSFFWGKCPRLQFWVGMRSMYMLVLQDTALLFGSDGSISHSFHQGVSDSVSPCPHQHSKLSLFFIRLTMKLFRKVKSIHICTFGHLLCFKSEVFQEIKLPFIVRD